MLEKEKMRLEHLVVLESNEMLKKWQQHVKRIQNLLERVPSGQNGENSMNNDGIDFNPENILYESILIQKND